MLHGIATCERLPCSLWCASLYSGRARAVVGNACDVETQYPGAAGVFSLFGLQQLPKAHLALANWVRALAPGELDPHTWQLPLQH